VIEILKPVMNLYYLSFGQVEILKIFKHLLQM